MLGPRCFVPAAITATLLGLAAQSAGAATLTTDHQCYRASQLMRVTTSGFPAGALVLFRGNGGSLRLSYPDEQAGGLSGDGTVSVQVPRIAEGTEIPATGIPLALDAESYLPQPDAENLRTAASASLRLIDDFLVTRTPLNPAPRGKVTIRIRGAVELTHVYLHVSRQTLAGRGRILARRTIDLGAPAPPCGTLTARVDATGWRAPKPGIYSSTVDLSPTPDSDVEGAPQVSLRALFVRRR